MKKLKCSNDQCEGKENPSFSVTVSVYDNFSLAEPLEKLSGNEFECNHCQCVASVIEDN